MKRIALTQGKFALIDDGDYERLNQFKWCVFQNKNTWYAHRHSHRIGGRQILIAMHREILGLQRGDGKQCDHVDGNGLNNQRTNIRICTAQQNSFNRTPKCGSSRFKGIHWHKRDKRWGADIKYKRKTIFLGNFDNEIEAGKAYDRAALMYFGEFARLNFPITGG